MITLLAQWLNDYTEFMVRMITSPAMKAAHNWEFSVFHAIEHVVTSPFVVSALIETGKLIAVTLAAFGVAMAYPRTRRASVALLRFTKRYSPRWALPMLTAAAFFPGQADEIVVVAIVLIPILRSAHKRTVFARYLQYAWRG